MTRPRDALGLLRPRVWVPGLAKRWAASDFWLPGQGGAKGSGRPKPYLVAVIDLIDPRYLHDLKREVDRILMPQLRWATPVATGRTRRGYFTAVEGDKLVIRNRNPWAAVAQNTEGERLPEIARRVINNHLAEAMERVKL